MSKTLNAIEKCRTAELGAHEDVCDYCGHKKISYNSCRNRHCPKCLTSAKEKWIYNQKLEYKLTYEEIRNILGFDIDHSFLKYKKE